MFEFVLRAAETDGQSLTRWDQATPVTVRAETKQDAIAKAAKVLGNPLRSGYWWTFIVDDIREVEPTETELWNKAEERQR